VALNESPADGSELAGSEDHTPILCGFKSPLSRAIDRSIEIKMLLLKAVAFAAGLGLSMLSSPAHAVPVSGSDTVPGLYDALLNTKKNGRTLGQSGRLAQLEPVIRRSLDIGGPRRIVLEYGWVGVVDKELAATRAAAATMIEDQVSVANAEPFRRKSPAHARFGNSA